MLDGYTFKSMNKDYKYDLLMEKDGVDIKFECKYDIKMNKTGNVYIETGTSRRITKGGGKGKSGLYTSCADYYVIGDYNYYMIILTEKLHEAVQMHGIERYYIHPTNPRKNNVGCVIKVNDLKQYCKYIFNSCK